MKIFPLSEGRFTVDGTKQFRPFGEGEQLQDRPAGSLLVEIQPFLIITSKDIILLDSGLGFMQNGKLQLHQNIMNAGVNPAEVTKVLVSHLHKDHAGGLVLQQDGQPDQAAFPNATYYISRQEMEAAMEKKSSSYQAERFAFLQSYPKSEWLGEEGMIDEYIQYKHSGAHSPWHQVFTIREEGQTVFFGGDEAPQLQQMKHRFAAKYDFDGRKAMELRQQWWKQGAEEHWTFLFYHDIAHAVWTFA